MQPDAIRALLEEVRAGELPIDDAMRTLAGLPFGDLGYAKIDHHRALRTGMPEVIFGEGKTPEQVLGILKELRSTGQVGFVTRIRPEAAAHVLEAFPDATYHASSRTLLVRDEIEHVARGRICVASAGTSDEPVAEEAAITADVLHCQVERVYDVGVAGLHRLLAHREQLEASDVVIVVAGMEGALASVVAGLTSRPVVAVPTSVGYGANFAGLAALLGMLTSCAPGVCVVNIDNGFGAACVAARMSRDER